MNIQQQLEKVNVVESFNNTFDTEESIINEQLYLSFETGLLSFELE